MAERRKDDVEDKEPLRVTSDPGAPLVTGPKPTPMMGPTPPTHGSGQAPASAERGTSGEAQTPPIEDDDDDDDEKKPKLKHRFTAHVGDSVHMPGNVFHVAGGYNWEAVGPRGRVVGMMNADKVGASFVAEEEGDYTIHLDTLDGPAVVTVHVTEKKKKRDDD
jgi:hypothetical protein